MSKNPIIRYETAPTLSVRYPDCNSCLVEVEHDGDGWHCLRCGTTWGVNDSEETPGTLYEEWAGEDNPGILRAHDDGWERAPGDGPSAMESFGARLAAATNSTRRTP